MTNDTNFKPDITTFLDYVRNKANTKDFYLKRRLCIILLLVLTSLNLKELLNLTISNIKDLETKGNTIYKTESLLKKVKLDLNNHQDIISHVFENFYINKSEENYVFTTLYNSKKPLYTSNVRKKLVMTIYNILEETESKVNLTYLITDKIIP